MRMLLRLFVGFLSLGMAMSAPVLAADERPSVADADNARTTLRFYADCLADAHIDRRRAARVAAFLRVSPLAGDLRSVVAPLYDPNCLFGRTLKNDQYVSLLKIKPLLLRGALFRSLYRNRFGSSTKPTLVAIMPEPAPWRLSNDGGFTQLQQFGECVVRLNPEHSHGFVFVAAGSKSEAAELAALGPTLAACVAPGSTIKFSKSMMESLLAEAMFNLAGGTLAPVPASLATDAKKAG